MKKSFKRNKGFTLVELIVTIAIISILASVSVVGYFSFVNKAKISNDEMLVDQINMLVFGHKLNNSTSYSKNYIARKLQNYFEKDVEIQSKDLDMNIYYNCDAYKFELISIDKSKNYRTLHELLNLRIEPSFRIKQEIIDNSNTKYVDISIVLNDDEVKVKSTTININDLIENLDGIDLNYSLSTISKVNYENINDLDGNNINMDDPFITDSNNITFSYPGTFALTISDGIYQNTIIINVINTDKDIAKLSDNYELQQGTYYPDTNILSLQVLTFFKIHDYYNVLKIEENPINKPAKYFFEDINDITTFRRLFVKINGQRVDLNKKLEASIIKPDNNKIHIEYYYQGINGQWVYHEQIIDTAYKDDNKEYQKVQIEIVKTEGTH